LNLGLVDAIKYHQRQHELLEKQDEGDKALFKIVCVKSIAQMSSQSDEPMSSRDNDLFVKEEANYDSDATVIYEPEENNWVSYFFKIFVCSMLPNICASCYIFRRCVKVEPLARR